MVEVFGASIVCFRGSGASGAQRVTGGLDRFLELKGCEHGRECAVPPELSLEGPEEATKKQTPEAARLRSSKVASSHSSCNN